MCGKDTLNFALDRKDLERISYSDPMSLLAQLLIRHSLWNLLPAACVYNRNNLVSSTLGRKILDIWACVYLGARFHSIRSRATMSHQTWCA